MPAFCAQTMNDDVVPIKGLGPITRGGRNLALIFTICKMSERSSPSLSARLPQSGAHNADIEVENQFDRHHWAIG
jgi:hypothetical protein